MSVKLLVEKDVFVLTLTTDWETWSNVDSATVRGELYIATTFRADAVKCGRYAAVVQSYMLHPA